MEEKKHWILGAVFLAVVIVTSLSGFFPNGKWGISDWDYYFSYHEVVRTMFLEHGEIPQWNPYICGGTSGIGDPEFPLLAPTFLLELAFGVPVGLRLAIFATTIATGIGILLLARRLKFSVFAGTIAGLAAALSSVSLLEVVEGHPNVFAAAYVPWVLYFWLGRKKFLTGLMLALMFFQGGIYLLMYMAFVFAFLIIFAKNKLYRLKQTTVIGAIALGLAAIKIVPVIYWLQEFQDQVYASSAFTLPYLHEIFLGRNLHGVEFENIIPNQGGGWHEYGAYLGFAIVGLALVSLLKLKNSRLVRLLWLGAILATVVSATGPFLKPFFDQASWLPRSNVSRVILMAVLPLSLLAGVGLDFVLQKTKEMKIKTVVAAIIILIASWELGTLANKLSQQAFVLEPAAISKPASHPIEHTIDTETVRVGGVDHTRAYSQILAGVGTQSYCSVLSPEPAVKTRQHKEEDQSFVILDPPEAGTAELVSWKPNEVVVSANLSEPAVVTINTNFAQGWSVNDELVDNNSGRAAAKLDAGEHSLVFKFNARGFKAGATITVTTIAILLAVVVRQRKTSSPDKTDSQEESS